MVKIRILQGLSSYDGWSVQSWLGLCFSNSSKGACPRCQHKSRFLDVFPLITSSECLHVWRSGARKGLLKISWSTTFYANRRVRFSIASSHNWLWCRCLLLGRQYANVQGLPQVLNALINWVHWILRNFEMWWTLKSSFNWWCWLESETRILPLSIGGALFVSRLVLSYWRYAILLIKVFSWMQHM